MASAALRGSKLSDEVRAVLARTSTDGTALYLPPQLDRKTYQAVNKVIEALGGTWNRTAKAHVFPEPVDPLLAALLHTGDVPAANPLSFFWSPEPVVDAILSNAGIPHSPNEKFHILEPSAGEGHIARAIRHEYPHATLHCIELDATRARSLVDQGFQTVHESFLNYHPTPAFRYDRILMNPPFAVDGDATAWLTHIEHARTMLARGGCLVSVVPAGALFRADRKHTAFREIAASIEPLPDEAFAPAGTNISAAIAVVEG